MCHPNPANWSSWVEPLRVWDLLLLTSTCHFLQHSVSLCLYPLLLTPLLTPAMYTKQYTHSLSLVSVQSESHTQYTPPHIIRILTTRQLTLGSDLARQCRYSLRMKRTQLHQKLTQYICNVQLGYWCFDCVAVIASDDRSSYTQKL